MQPSLAAQVIAFAMDCPRGRVEASMEASWKSGGALVRSAVKFLRIAVHEVRELCDESAPVRLAVVAHRANRPWRSLELHGQCFVDVSFLFHPPSYAGRV